MVITYNSDGIIRRRTMFPSRILCFLSFLSLSLSYPLTLVLVLNCMGIEHKEILIIGLFYHAKDQFNSIIDYYYYCSSVHALSHSLLSSIRISNKGMRMRRCASVE